MECHIRNITSENIGILLKTVYNRTRRISENKSHVTGNTYTHTHICIYSNSYEYPCVMSANYICMNVAIKKKKMKNLTKSLVNVILLLYVRSYLRVSA